MFDSLWPQGLQHTRLPCPSPNPRAYSNSCPSSQWCHPTISSSIIPFSSCLNLSQHQGLSQWVSSLYQVAKVFEIQHQLFQWIFRPDFLEDWLVWSPCSPTHSEESSLEPQFKNINSSALSFLYGPALTSIHDYWKNHSFDCTDLFSQVISLLFNMLSRLVTAFLPRSNCLNFMAAITFWSDFGAPKI